MEVTRVTSAEVPEQGRDSLGVAPVTSEAVRETDRTDRKMSRADSPGVREDRDGNDMFDAHWNHVSLKHGDNIQLV